jgi:hypothetical protein
MRKRYLVLGGAAALLALVIGCASTTSTTPPASTSTPATSAPATPSAPATHSANPTPEHTITYKVSGSPADVTYGPSGSSYTGTVPMSKTMSLGDSDAAYYAITAQLQGGGAVNCAIVIDGQTITTAHADGGYNIAQCEVLKDPITGKWTHV